MPWTKIAIASLAALMLSGCAPAVGYADLYPKSPGYRWGKPLPNYGTGPVAMPGAGIPSKPKDWK
jgi:hypothetical protein